MEQVCLVRKTITIHTSLANIKYISLTFRDSTEKLKTLTSEEKKEIISKENRGKLGSISTSVFSYSPRKERALKIYLDTTPPRRRDESDVD